MLTAQEIKNAIEKAEKQIEELRELLSTVEAEPGNRQVKGGIYYYVDIDGGVDFAKELSDKTDDDLHRCGNYYLTKEDAIRAEKQIRLFRLLDRFSRENGWDDKLWEDGRITKYHICKDCGIKEIEIVVAQWCRQPTVVYFASEEIAEQAIEKFRDLLEEVL